MELRHLRYFIAVAEDGNVTGAAERRLHISQPSLSRQIRQLEAEVGATLLERGARGVVLTASGRVFLDHARLALLQVDAAAESARLAQQPQKPVVVVGFHIGQEVAWLPDTLRILREEAPDVEVMLSSQQSPDLAAALMRGTLHVAFLRREKLTTGIAFKLLVREPLFVVVPVGHRLASRNAIPPQELECETYISPARRSPVLQSVIDDYAATLCLTLRQEYDAETLSAAMSLVESTGGVTLCPLYGQSILTRAVVARPLEGEPPTIDLMMGYNKSNVSPVVERLLSRSDELVERVSHKQNYLWQMVTQ